MDGPNNLEFIEKYIKRMIIKVKIYEIKQQKYFD